MRQNPPSPPACPARSLNARNAVAAAALATLAGLFGSASTAEAQMQPPSNGNRVLGFDISAWQGDITAAEWDTFHRPTNQQNAQGTFGDGRDFVFIRSSRGGTTGYYNQSNSDNDPPTNTLSQRYDDPYFIRNVTRATAAGLYAGTYHFSRPDIMEGTLNSGGIRNNGTDEANHFIQMAGPWMRPGYLPPVHDLEAGISQRTSNEMAQFSIDFSNRIYEVMGIRPAVYTNGSYADELQAASSSLRTQLLAAYPILWSARWPNQDFPHTINVQSGQPKDSYSSIYGPWDDAVPGGHPWVFWQYASTHPLNGNNGGNSATDVNVVHGNIEYLKDQLIPAVWMNGSSGSWGTPSNWNSGQLAVAPVQGPGQVGRVGGMTLPGARLPGQPDPSNAANGTNVTGEDDTVNLNRPNENITVTFDAAAGDTTIRKLFLNERLNVTGGNLTVRMGGVAGTGGTLALSGGTVTMDSAIFDVASALEFGGSGTLAVGSVLLNSGLTFNGASGTGVLKAKAGAASPTVNLGNATRTANIGEGSAAVDMRIELPLTNGNLTKTGAGTLELTANNGSYTGNLTVAGGHLLITNPNQLGTTGVSTSQNATVNTDGGTVRLQGGINVNKTITIAGTGFNNTAALENLSGNNTWSGLVQLAGDQHNQNNARLNQIGAAAGSLTITGIIQNSGGGTRSFAKTGAGDLVLGGTAVNTYNGLTRVFAGRLIVEKNGALGTLGSSTVADANTFQLPGAVSTLAFRAPSGSPGLNYSTIEWIHTEGTGVGGLGQLDSLGGDNVFAGNVGIGGPAVGGRRQGSIGVSTGSLELTGGIYSRYDTTAPTDIARDITKLGAGTLIISGDSAADPTNGSDRSLVTSNFNVNAGTLVLKGTAGNTANVPGITGWGVGSGATLRAERAGATGTAGLTLTGGTFHTTAAAGAYTVGSLAVAPTGTGGTVDVGGTSLGVSGAFGVGAGRTLAKNGSGTLNITGAQSHGAGSTLDVNAGSVNVHTDAGGISTFNLAVNVDPAASVQFLTAQHLTDLTIGSGGAQAQLAPGKASTLRSRGLTIANGGTLYTQDNDVVIDYPAGGPSPYSRIAGYVVNAFAGNAGGVIRVADHESRQRVLAVFDNAAVGFTSWGGQPVDASSVIGSYIDFGDSNLEGGIVVVDVEQGGGGGGGSGNAWYLGDYNADGRVTVLDIAALDANLGVGLNDPTLDAVRAQRITANSALYGAPYTTALAMGEAGDLSFLYTGVVPEPSSALALLALGAGVMGVRRRRL